MQVPPDPVLEYQVNLLSLRVLDPAVTDLTTSFATAKSTARPSCLVCVLYDIYRETINRSTANQPLLGNWPRKLSNSAKLRKIMAITPLRVMQGHRFWYHSKAHVRLPISD